VRSWDSLFPARQAIQNTSLLFDGAAISLAAFGSLLISSSQLSSANCAGERAWLCGLRGGDPSKNLDQMPRRASADARDAGAETVVSSQFVVRSSQLNLGVCSGWDRIRSEGFADAGHDAR